jgi:hypothetical protein
MPTSAAPSFAMIQTLRESPRLFRRSASTRNRYSCALHLAVVNQYGCRLLDLAAGGLEIDNKLQLLGLSRPDGQRQSGYHATIAGGQNPDDSNWRKRQIAHHRGCRSLLASLPCSNVNGRGIDRIVVAPQVAKSVGDRTELPHNAGP